MNAASRPGERLTVALDVTPSVPAKRDGPTMQAQVDSLAADVGRLRLRVHEDDYGTHLLDRIASSVEIIDAALQPTAAAIYRENFICSLDDELAVECALEDVDDRKQHLRRLLGIPEATLPSCARIRQLVDEMAAA